MICPNCGKEIVENINFCPYCGEKFENEKSNPAEDVLEQPIDKKITSNVTETKPQTSTSAKKPKNKWKTILIIVVLLFLFFSGAIDRLMSLPSSMVNYLRGKDEDYDNQLDMSTFNATVETVPDGDSQSVSNETSTDGQTPENDTEIEPIKKDSLNTKEELSAYADYPFYSLEFLCYYLNLNDIEAHIVDLSEKQEKLNNESSNYITLKNEVGGFFESDYYVATSNYTNEDKLIYFGETKDNKPDGFGTLYQIVQGTLYDDDEGNYTLDVYYPSLLNQEDQYLTQVYVGFFKDGRFHGQGTRYCTYNDSSDLEVSLSNIPISKEIYQLYGNDIQQLIYLAGNPILYSGEFENGQYSGKGSKFSYLISNDNGNFISCNTGTFKEGVENGTIKEYLCGFFHFEGEMKDGLYHGKGKEYYLLSDKLLYDGEYRNGIYHGTGTKYDGNGNEIYSGKWKNGDYAH